MKGIIIFGAMGSGKDTLAEMLEKRIFCSKIYKLGEDIRKIVDNASPGRDNRKLYQDYGQAVRQTLGADAWNNICKSKIERDESGLSLLFPIIADGRQLNEYEYWREQGFYVVGITASMGTRCERLEKRDGSCDISRMTHETELQAQFVVTQMADLIVDNNGPITDLNFAVREIVLKYANG